VGQVGGGGVYVEELFETEQCSKAGFSLPNHIVIALNLHVHVTGFGRWEWEQVVYFI